MSTMHWPIQVLLAMVRPVEGWTWQSASPLMFKRGCSSRGLWCKGTSLVCKCLRAHLVGICRLCSIQPARRKVAHAVMGVALSPLLPPRGAKAAVPPSQQWPPCMAACRQRRTRRGPARAAVDAAPQIQVKAEAELPGVSDFLSSLKWDVAGLVTVIAQHVDTGDVLMQAFADRDALTETFQTRLATFYSRSRKGRWCKGESSGHFMKVLSIHLDCDRDSIIYVCDPIGPACHTNAPTCYFTEAQLTEQGLQEAGTSDSRAHSPASSLYALEGIIAQRRLAAADNPAGKPSWTAKLAGNPSLLCSKIREEAGELCQTLEQNEGQQRSASEMADLLYHSMVLLGVQGVGMQDVLRELRSRFAVSGLDEKASRVSKQA